MPEITITLNAGYEKLNPTNPLGLTLPPLYHQQRTYGALKTNELVINTYNTGTGKTHASLAPVVRSGRRKCSVYCSDK